MDNSALEIKTMEHGEAITRLVVIQEKMNEMFLTMQQLHKENINENKKMHDEHYKDIGAFKVFLQKLDFITGNYGERIRLLEDIVKRVIIVEEKVNNLEAKEEKKEENKEKIFFMDKDQFFHWKFWAITSLIIGTLYFSTHISIFTVNNR